MQASVHRPPAASSGISSKSSPWICPLSDPPWTQFVVLSQSFHLSGLPSPSLLHSLCPPPMSPSVPPFVSMARGCAFRQGGDLSHPNGLLFCFYHSCALWSPLDCVIWFRCVRLIILFCSTILIVFCSLFSVWSTTSMSYAMYTCLPASCVCPIVDLLKDYLKLSSLPLCVYLTVA